MKRVRQTKKDTSKEIWNVIHLMESKDIKITIKEVCNQANISRTTLYHYPEIKDYVILKNKKTDKELFDEIKKLKNEIKDLKSYIETVEKERNAALINQFKNIEKLNVK